MMRLISYEDFASRARALEQSIADICAACGRSPGEIRLMAVTKTQPLEAAAYAARYGLACVGENRIQEAVEKISRADFSIPWEFIGHLQTNKTALAVRHFDRVQSVDSEKLVARLDRGCREQDRILPVLLQINSGGDEAKFGASIEAASPLLEAALNAPRLRVEGLMTVAPLSDAPSDARRAFVRLRELRDRLQRDFGVTLPELSMGMTGDLREAVEEGSTCVRIGSALYGPRQ